MKGRLEDMEGKYNVLQEQMLNMTDQKTHLETEVQQKDIAVNENVKQTTEMSIKISQLTEEVNSLREKVRSKDHQIEDLEYSKSADARRIKSLGRIA